jgi:lysophospholipase L1-like esterase
MQRVDARSRTVASPDREGRAVSDARRILCYGDSLTWGWVPVEEANPTWRYPREQRWTGALQSALGDGFEVIEDGVSARTTNVDDPLDPRLNGARYLPTALAAHSPLDLVVLLLGTNDTKAQFGRSSYEIATGLAELVGQVLTSPGGVGTTYPTPRVLIVSPPPLAPMPHPWFAGMFEGAHEKSRELPAHYAALASFVGVGYFEAGQVISTDGCDGIHLTASSNVELGTALADKVRSMLSSP